jgi:hypothetical protein
MKLFYRLFADLQSRTLFQCGVNLSEAPNFHRGMSLTR